MKKQKRKSKPLTKAEKKRIEQFVIDFYARHDKAMSVLAWED